MCLPFYGKKEKEKYKEIHRYMDISDIEMEKDVEREREPAYKISHKGFLKI